MVDAGFAIAHEFLPCDPARHGGFACGFRGTKARDIGTVYDYESGQDANNLGIAREGFSIVELRAYDNPDAEGEP